MTLQEAIREIISRNFKPGDIFDSHSVIFLLSRNEKYAETYMKNISPEMNIKQYHAHIAKNISLFDDCVEAVDEKIITPNIFGELSKNQVWKRK